MLVIHEPKFKDVGGRWPAAGVHNEGAGGDLWPREASLPLQKVLATPSLHFINYLLAPLHNLYPGSRSLKWTLVSSTFRIATQIASGIELGAVDPFAGVALMEEHIRDANRFVTNVCMLSTLFQVYSAITQPCWRSERTQQLCGGNSDGTGQIQESLQRLGVISLNRPSQHPGSLKCCQVL